MSVCFIAHHTCHLTSNQAFPYALSVWMLKSASFRSQIDPKSEDHILLGSHFRSYAEHFDVRTARSRDTSVELVEALPLHHHCLQDNALHQEQQTRHQVIVMHHDIMASRPHAITSSRHHVFMSSRNHRYFNGHH